MQLCQATGNKGRTSLPRQFVDTPAWRERRVMDAWKGHDATAYPITHLEQLLEIKKKPAKRSYLSVSRLGLEPTTPGLQLPGESTVEVVVGSPMAALQIAIGRPKNLNVPLEAARIQA